MTCTVERAPLAAATAALIKVGTAAEARMSVFKGHCVLSATDGKTWLHLTIEGSGELTPFCVSAARLHEAVSSFGAELLGFQVDGSSLRIFGGKGRRSLPISPTDAFPDPEYQGRPIITLPGDRLREVLAFTLPHVPDIEDVAKAPLAGVFLFTDEGRLKALGTDGAEAGLVDVGPATGTVDLALPKRPAELAARLVSGDVEISASERVLEVRWIGGVIRAPLLADPICTEKLVRHTKFSLDTGAGDLKPFTSSVEASAFRSALQGVRGMGENDHGSRGKRVKLSLNGVATLSTGSQDGSAEEELFMDLSEARRLELGFASTRMERVLRGFGDAVLDITFRDSVQPIKFEAAGQPDRVALLFPMRI